MPSFYEPFAQDAGYRHFFTRRYSFAGIMASQGLWPRRIFILAATSSSVSFRAERSEAEESPHFLRCATGASLSITCQVPISISYSNKRK